MMVYALVLAGQTDTSAFPEEEGISNESLLKVGGKPMLYYVIEALSGCESIEEIVLVGPPDQLKEVAGDCIMVESGDNIVENIRRGAEAVPADGRLLICGSDIPLIKSEIIERFLNSCREQEASFYMPIVSKESSEAVFPGGDRTYANLAEGTFTAGNCFMVSSTVLEDGLSLAETFIGARKNVLHLAWLLGPLFILKLVLQKLSLREVEDRISYLVGHRVKAIISEDPEVAFDVDKPQDLKTVRERISV